MVIGIKAKKVRLMSDADCRTPPILNFTRLWAPVGTYGHCIHSPATSIFASMEHLKSGLYWAYKKVDSGLVEPRIPTQHAGFCPFPVCCAGTLPL
jgi:hypothetical protein